MTDLTAQQAAARAIALLRDKRPAEAAAFMRRAIQLDPKWPSTCII